MELTMLCRLKHALLANNINLFSNLFTQPAQKRLSGLKHYCDGVMRDSDESARKR